MIETRAAINALGGPWLGQAQVHPPVQKHDAPSSSVLIRAWFIAL